MRAAAVQALQFPPSAFGLQPDADGWVDLNALLLALAGSRPSWARLSARELRLADEQADVSGLEFTVPHGAGGFVRSRLNAHGQVRGLSLRGQGLPAWLYCALDVDDAVRAVRAGLLGDGGVTLQDEPAACVGGALVLAVHTRSAAERGVGFRARGTGRWWAPRIPREHLMVYTSRQ